LRELIRTTVIKFFGFQIFTFDEWEEIGSEPLTEKPPLPVKGKVRENSLVEALETQDSVFPPPVNIVRD
jgi:hypothetical protein